jgi:hypothetical protein
VTLWVPNNELGRSTEALAKQNYRWNSMKISTYKKYSREDQKLLAIWAADCAERVLPFFEKEYPEDDRPRRAIEECRAWVRTGVFRMADIRGASLASHAAGRDAKQNEAACFAAHAAGQAVATAHVPQHAYGSAYYALKAIAATDPVTAGAKIAKERSWQSHRIPEKLREQIMKRLIVQERGNRIVIKIQKGKGF